MTGSFVTPFSFTAVQTTTSSSLSACRPMIVTKATVVTFLDLQQRRGQQTILSVTISHASASVQYCHDPPPEGGNGLLPTSTIPLSSLKPIINHRIGKKNQ